MAETKIEKLAELTVLKKELSKFNSWRNRIETIVTKLKGDKGFDADVASAFSEEELEELGSILDDAKVVVADAKPANDIAVRLNKM